MGRSYRHIEISQSKDELLGGPEVHKIKFCAGEFSKEVVLTTRELLELKQKLGIYLYTYNIIEPKQLELFK